jgi:hypothetical protein
MKRESWLVSLSQVLNEYTGMGCKLGIEVQMWVGLGLGLGLDKKGVCKTKILVIPPYQQG